jgi:predicted metal-binding transcription factor (methanogenesis marker protein 9)
METRYAKKKLKLRESSKDEVVKLKHQLAEALKVANLKSEEAIKLKAELHERT